MSLALRLHGWCTSIGQPPHHRNGGRPGSLVLLLILASSGCYRSHGREAERDAGPEETCEAATLSIALDEPADPSFPLLVRTERCRVVVAWNDTEARALSFRPDAPPAVGAWSDLAVQAVAVERGGTARALLFERSLSGALLESSIPGDAAQLDVRSREAPSPLGDDAVASARDGTNWMGLRTLAADGVDAIEVWRRRPGASWGRLARIREVRRDDEAVLLGAPRVCSSGDRVVIAWTESEPGPTGRVEVHAAQGGAARSFVEMRVAVAAVGSAPALACVEDGPALLAFRRGTAQLEVHALAPGGTWSPRAVVDESATPPDASPRRGGRLSIGARRGLWLWHDFVGAYAMVDREGGLVLPARLLNEPGQPGEIGVASCALRHRNAFAVAVDRRETSELAIRTIDEGGDHETTMTIAPYDELAAVALGCDDFGGVVIAWIDRTGHTARVRARSVRL